MNWQPELFPFIEINPSPRTIRLFPYLPLTLSHKARSVDVHGLLDTGASMNVLPFDIGLQLGAVWEQETIEVELTGNLGQHDARALVLTATVGGFPPVRLAFAWASTNSCPVMLGHINFFLEFDVCFFRSRSIFEIKPK